jgi:hypothetical protein
MQVSTSPTLVPLPFADSGAKNVIPEAASPTPGLASLTTGFPPVTMTPLAAGGIPPAGQDMNGILNLITQTTRWTQAGGPFAYSSSFATDSNVNGYPQGAVISRADFTGQWISTADNNTVNPDTVGTNWVPGYNYGVTAITGLTNANVTLTPAQAAKNRITLAGTLTGNVQIILPTWTKDWTIVNNTTGAFTATVKTASGTGIAIPQDASPTKVTGDGTNITQLAENVPPATQSQHAVQMAQAAGVVGSVRNLVMSVTAASATATLAADEIIVETALGGVRYCLPSFSKTINLATTGAGGMDTGSAPVSGYVALYAIWNPTTQTAALLATNCTSIVAPSVYGAGSMPSGYTASGLVGVWPTNASSQFPAGYQYDRNFWQSTLVSVVTSTVALSNSSLSIAAGVPKNAKTVTLNTNQLTATGATAYALTIAGGTLSGTNGIGQVTLNVATSSTNQAEGVAVIPLPTAQTIWVTWTVTGGSSPQLNLYATGYTL